MKTKTDIYSKVVQTAIAIFLGVLVFKDVNFVSKVQANELDLSALKIEDVSNEKGITFYVYDNDELEAGFGSEEYVVQRYNYISPTMGKKDPHKAYIEEGYNIPKYIITSKTGTFWLEK